jgi:phage head maturation protease
MKKTLKIPAELRRFGEFARAEDGTLRLSISSEEPYERFDWFEGERYYEVLDHSPEGCDLSRLRNGAALLFNHDRHILLGKLSNPTCENGRCYVDAKISQAPDVASYRTKIEEGILKDTSIGYEITSDGVKIGMKNGLPIYKFKFAVHEASLVTIPADTTVGVGRSRDNSDKPELREISVQSENNIDSEQNPSHTRAMPELAKNPENPNNPIDVEAERRSEVEQY